VQNYLKWLLIFFLTPYYEKGNQQYEDRSHLINSNLNEHDNNNNSKHIQSTTYDDL